MNSDKLYEYNENTTFVYIDASKKQEFIYEEKVLKKNIERSLIIRFITEWISKDELDEIKADECLSLKKVEKLENIKPNDLKDLNDSKETKKTNELILLREVADLYGAKLIFSGGGNSIIKFETENKASEFIKLYSLLILSNHPNLELYMSSVNVGKFIDENRDEATNIKMKIKDRMLEPMIHKELEKKLNEIKDIRKSGLKKSTYGIEKIKTNSNHNLKSKNDKEAKEAKENHYFKAMKEHFTKHFEIELLNSDPEKSAEDIKLEMASNKVKDISKRVNFKLDYYKNPTDDKAIDKNSGNFEEKNYIGIIAIDGNKMGELVRNLKNFYLDELDLSPSEKEKYKNLNKNNYFKSLKLFGEQINSVYCNAIRKTINQENVNEDSNLKENIKNARITPIVMAGDDITLVFKSTISIQLTNQIMENIEDEVVVSDEEITESSNYTIVRELMKSLGLKKLTSGAGIAIVKAGYPFFEAIQLAEGIQKESKKAIYKFAKKEEKQKEKENNHSFLDWKVIEGGKLEEIDYVKYAEKGLIEKEYHIKPLYVSGSKTKDKDQLFLNPNSEFIRIARNNFENNIFTFKGFEILLEKLNEINWDCESIKKEMYGSAGRYEMIFNMSKEDRINKIDGILKKNEDLVVKFSSLEINNGKLIEKIKEKVIKETYLLNDFIEARKFLINESEKGGE